MTITEHTHNTVSIFSPQGRIDDQGAADLERTLQAAFEAGKTQMILDLSQVTYINSAGLRILAAMLIQNQNGGGDLLLIVPLPRIRRVLQIVGFDHFFRLFESVEAALGVF